MLKTDWLLAGLILLCCGWLGSGQARGEGAVTLPPGPLEENGTNFVVSGSVRVDQNRDGAFGGDAALTNATVLLVADLDGNGRLDLGEPQIGSQSTDGSGQFAFVAVTNGVYLVIEADPLGYVSVTDSAEIDPSNDCNTVRVTVNGADVSGIGFLDAPTGTIGNRVWLDENANALRDAGERGIANVSVRLFGSDGALLDTQRTDTEGQYLFHGFAPGLYYVNVLDGTDNDADGVNTLPAGMIQTPPLQPSPFYGNQDHALTPVPNLNGVYGFPVLLTGGTTCRTPGFGYNWAPSQNVSGNRGTGALGDRIWSDADGNGRQDPGEPGLAGAAGLMIYDSDGDGFLNATQTVTATADGTYGISGLPSGAYRLAVPTPAGYAQTGDPDAWIDGQTTHPILLAPGDVYVNADFGYQPLSGHAASVSVQVWLDAKADSVFNGTDAGLANVTAALIRDENADGIWNAEEPVIAVTATGPDGTCSFNGVPCADGQGTDDYLVWVNDTSGTLAGMVESADSDGTATPRTSAVADLAPTGTATQSFGFALARQTHESGAIGNTVFLDRNLSGTFDLGEGLEDIRVFLYAANGSTLLRATQTDLNGRYAFGDLANGSYVVIIDETSLPGPPYALFNSVDPDLNVPGQSRVTLNQSLDTDWEQDFGYEVLLQPNTIEGTVWNDRNADGVLNEGACGIAGVTLRVYIDGGGVALTLTDSSGHYIVEGLPPGNCQIDVTDTRNVLDGLWHSRGTPGADSHSQTDPYFVVIDGGQDYPADFGYYAQGAAVGDLVWDDLNANGLQDAGEPGVSNACVELTALYADGSTHHVKTLTDETGHYLFDHLLLDEQDGDSNATRYVIAPLLSAPYRPSPADQGTDDAADSDSQDGVVADVTRGECAEHYDFGTYMGGVVEGFVFRDDNGDLLRTAGDSSVTNIPVRLVGPDAFGATTNTDAHGYFRFEWVPPSSVSVLVSRVDAALAAVPAEEPDASDARRNRALPDDGGEDAFIAHSVTSGTGVLADRPSSTLNFGFVSYPLSTAVGLSLHAAADGVMIELWTENESGDGDIVIGAWIDNAWTEIGRIPAGQLAGEGSNRYTVRAHGLSADGAYLIRIVDESGHVHHSSEPVPVRALVAQAVRLEMDTLAVRFNTERGRRYCVWVSTDLVTWAPEYVSAPTAGGWSAFSVSPFTAGGLLTEVRVPLNGRKKAFFRVVMTD